MENAGHPRDPEVFSTYRQSKDHPPQQEYIRRMVEVARWDEEYGCKEILVYTDNSNVDPWLVAQIVIQNTNSLCPLVAFQAMYMHPATVAKMVASLGHLDGRRICLNMVASVFKNDLISLSDTTPHDQRYDRLIESTTVIRRLLENPAPVTFQGQFDRVTNLRMAPHLSPELFPGIFVPGFPKAGIAAAQAIEATTVKYPKSAKEYEVDFQDNTMDCGVRVGVIARKGEDQARRIAHERFPEPRKGQVIHRLAMKTSDSSWHKHLCELGEEAKKEVTSFWLVALENYKTFCHYLVGSYKRVAEELARCIAVGYRKFIHDIPPAQEGLCHTKIAFDFAWRRTAA